MFMFRFSKKSVRQELLVLSWLWQKSEAGIRKNVTKTMGCKRFLGKNRRLKLDFRSAYILRSRLEVGVDAIAIAEELSCHG